MFAILKRDWMMIDGETGEDKTITAGRHEIERIDNPFGHDNPWLVLKGSKIGRAENAWRDWENKGTINHPGHPKHGQPIDWGDREIIIEE